MAELIRLYFVAEGHTVETAATGTAGLEAALTVDPEVVLLDIMLPEMNGQDVCARIRKESSVPIIMVSARSAEEDTLTSLDLGADDYVTKPFSPRELVARVKAVVRRYNRQKSATPRMLEHAGVLINLDQQEARFNDKRLNLTPTEFRMLNFFVASGGQAVPRKRIADRTFGYEFEGLERTVDVHVHHLRRKLQAAGMKSSINTVYGVGYRFGD